MTDFERWVNDLIQAQYKTDLALADALGMSSSALRRGIERGTLGIESLLKLADVSGHSASEVLRLAGKGTIADLLERLYGPPLVLSRGLALVVRKYGRATKTGQRALEAVAQELPEVASPAPSDRPLDGLGQ